MFANRTGSSRLRKRNEVFSHFARPERKRKSTLNRRCWSSNRKQTARQSADRLNVLTEVHELLDAHRRRIESRVVLDQLRNLSEIHESQSHFEFDEMTEIKTEVCSLDVDWSAEKDLDKKDQIKKAS